jgi:hypothetical protein
MRKSVGPDTPSQPELPSHLTSVEIDRDLVVALRPEAARRETTVPRLINHLLAVTVEDKLTTADPRRLTAGACARPRNDQPH